MLTGCGCFQPSMSSMSQPCSARCCLRMPRLRTTTSPPPRALASSDLYLPTRLRNPVDPLTNPKQTIAGSRNQLNDHSPLASLQYSDLPQSHRADAHLAPLLSLRLEGESLERSEAVGQIKRLAASGSWWHPFRDCRA